ncbi:MAG TPA: hypothetical protein DCY13_17335, partial [Verrucomicrobiales bacterium]|nr:hypothetical protein [Verrucomicrobiales bacterium]
MSSIIRETMLAVKRASTACSPPRRCSKRWCRRDNRKRTFQAGPVNCSIPRYNVRRPTSLWLALVVAAFAGCQTRPVGSNLDPMKPAEALLQLDRPLVIAHRGFSSVAPENTLAAFERARFAGADLIELDYHHDRDGRPVVIHDSTLDRTSDATNRWGGKGIKVSAHPIAELKTLDVGRWFGAAFAGQRLPELAEAIDEIQRGSVTLIERKAGDAATCVALVRGKGLLNHVVVQSFDWEYLRDYRAREPEQILAALGPPGSWEGRKL